PKPGAVICSQVAAPKMAPKRLRRSPTPQPAVAACGRCPAHPPRSPRSSCAHPPRLRWARCARSSAPHRSVFVSRANLSCSASVWHLAMKLLFAAPLSGFPFDPTALGVQASRLHLAKKLVFAAPASGLPSLPTALLLQLSCASAVPIESAAINTASATL